MRIRTRKRVNKRDNTTDPYYQSADWRGKKNVVWVRDKYQCQRCKREGRIKVLERGTRDKNRQGTVDHIIPRNAGGSDELDNLELDCQRCHAKKSNEDKKRYR